VTEKKLTYAVEGGVDNQLLKGVRDLIAGVKSLDDTFKSVGKAVSVSVGQIKSEVKSTEQPVAQMSKAIDQGFRSIVKEIRGLIVEFRSIKNDVKNSLGYVQTESVKTGRAINRIAQESVKTGQAVRENLGKGAEAMKSFSDSTQKSATAAQRASAEVAKLATQTQSAGNAARDSGQSFTSMAQSIGLISSATATGLGLAMKKSIDHYANFESIMLKFGAVSGASTEEMKATRDEVARLGATTAFTASQVGDAAVALAKLGFSAKEVKSSIGGMVNTSLASGASLQEVSEIVASTVRQFGMLASQAGEVGDLITLTANSSSMSITDWGESMNYLGSAAAAAGQPLTDMAALLAELANSGLKGTMAGNGLRSAITRLQAPTSSAAAIMKQYGIEIKNAADGSMRNMIDIIIDMKEAFKDLGQVDQAGIINELFGEVSLKSMLVFFNKTDEQLRETQERMKDFQGVSGETANKMQQGLTKELMEMNSAVDGLKTNIGENLAPEMIKLAKLIKKTASDFREMSQWKKDLTKQGALLALGIGSITSALALGVLGMIKFIGFSKAMWAGLALSTKVTALKTAAVHQLQGALLLATVAQHGHTTAVAKGTAVARVFLMTWGPAIALFAAIGAGIYTIVQGLKAVGAELQNLENLEKINESTAKTFNLKMSTRGAAKKVDRMQRDGSAAKLTPKDYSDAAHDLTQQAGRLKAGSDERQKLLATAEAYRGVAKGLELASKWEYTNATAVENTTDKLKDQIKALEEKQSQDLKRVGIDRTNQLNALKSSELSSAVVSGASSMAAALDESTRSMAKNMNTVNRCYEGYWNALKKAEQVAGILDENGRVLKKGQSIWADVRTNEAASAYMFNAAAARAVKKGLLEEYRPQSISEITAGTTMVLPAGWHAKNVDGHVASVDNQGFDYSDHKDNILQRNPHLLKNQNVKFYRYKGSSADGQLEKEKQKIEEDALQRQLAIYVRDKAAYEQLLKSKSEADEGYAEVKGKILDLQGKIADSEGKLLDLGIDAAKKRKKAAEDALKETQKLLDEQLKSIEKYFSDTDKKLTSLLKGMQDKVEQLKEENLLATMSPDGQWAYALDKEYSKFLLDTSEAVEELELVKAEIDAISHSSSLMTAESQANLTQLQDRYKGLTKEIEEAAKVTKDFLPKSIKAAAIDDFDKWWAGYTEGLIKAREEGKAWLESLNGNSDALDELIDDMERGTYTLEDLQDVMQLNTSEFEQLSNMIAQYAGKRDFERGEARKQEALERTEEATRKTRAAFEDVFNGIIQITGQVIAQWERAGSESARLFGTLFDGAVNAGDAIKRLVTSGGTDISAWVQLASTALQTLLNVFNQVSESALRAGESIRNSMASIGASNRELEILDIKDKRIAALIAGDEKLAATLQLQIEVKTKDNSLENLLDEYLSGVRATSGLVAASVMEESLRGNNLDFRGMAEQLQAQYDGTQWTGRVGGDMARNLHAQSQMSEQLKMLWHYAEEAEKIHSQFNETKQAWRETNQEILVMANQGLPDLIDQYFRGQKQAESFSNAVESMVKEFAGADIGLSEALRPIAESLQKEKDSIIDEVKAAFGWDFAIGWDAAAPGWEDELNRRLKGFGEKVSKAMTDGMQKSAEEGRKRVEAELAKAEQALKGRSDALKRALEKQFEFVSSSLTNAISLEQKRLDKINEQTRAIQKQIQLREDERRKELARFDADDQGIFAGMVRNVDYDAAVRQGLDDIHNPEGVLTGTYSDKSIEEAIAERIALMELENENRFKLEQVTRDDYLKNQQQIAALQSRAAEEALKTEGLTNRQRLELERQRADAYVKFQQAYREAINNRVDNEINALQRSVDANNRQAEEIQDNLDQHNRELHALRDTYEKDTQLINESIQAVLDKNSEWAFSVEDLESGIEGPLNRIIEMYKTASAAASSLLSSNAASYSGGGGGGGGASSGRDYLAVSAGIVADTSGSGSAPAQTAAQRATITPSGGYSPYSPVPKFAKGGVVPDGYPNDGYFAKLTSREPVFPAWFGDLLERTHRTNAVASSGGQALNNQRSSTVINLHMDGIYNEPGMVRREIVEALREADRSGGGNQAYYMSPGMI